MRTSKQKPRIRKGGRLFEYSIFQWLRNGLLFIASSLIRLYLFTLKDVTPKETQEKYRSLKSPALTILWHNHLFVAPHFRKYRSPYKVAAMISAGTLGAWISIIYKNFNIDAVRGSVNLRNKQALKELLQAIQLDKKEVAITPDGSRGPIYSFKSGAGLVALKTQCPIALLTVKFHNAWRLKTWDKFYIPKPFSKIEAHISTYNSIQDLTPSDKIESIVNALKDKMNSHTFDKN